LLEHNNVALQGLEKDLETAAKLGQVSGILFFFYTFAAIVSHTAALVGLGLGLGVVVCMAS
jgi:hypothetical protein